MVYIRAVDHPLCCYRFPPLIALQPLGGRPSFDPPDGPDLVPDKLSRGMSGCFPTCRSLTSSKRLSGCNSPLSGSGPITDVYPAVNVLAVLLILEHSVARKSHLKRASFPTDHWLHASARQPAPLLLGQACSAARAAGRSGLVGHSACYSLGGSTHARAVSPMSVCNSGRALTIFTVSKLT